MRRAILLFAALFFAVWSSAPVLARGRGGAGGDYGRSNPEKTEGVSGYTRADGTQVHSYYRRPAGMGSDRELEEHRGYRGSGSGSYGGSSYSGDSSFDSGATGSYAPHSALPAPASSFNGYPTEQARVQAVAEYHAANFPAEHIGSQSVDSSTDSTVAAVSSPDPNTRIVNTGGSPVAMVFAGLLLSGVGLVSRKRAR